MSERRKYRGWTAKQKIEIVLARQRLAAITDAIHAAGSVRQRKHLHLLASVSRTR